MTLSWTTQENFMSDTSTQQNLNQNNINLPNKVQTSLNFSFFFFSYLFFFLMNWMIQDGRTPLHTASRGGFVDIVERLLTKGADITIKDQVYFIIDCFIVNF